MSIIHFETMTALGAGSGGQLVYPLGGWDWNAGNGGPYVEYVDLTFYGIGTANPGTWDIVDFGILEASGEFLTNDGDGIESWMFRTTDIGNASGTIPGTVSYGAWSLGRTDWRTFGAGHTTGIVEIGSNSTPEWGASDNAFAPPNTGVAGYIEFSKYPRDTTDENQFEAAQVNLGSDTISIPGHTFSTGDQAVYIPGGAPINGTGSGSDTGIVANELLSIYVVDANTIQLGTNLLSVDSTPDLFNLTFTGTGTGHILRKIIPATASNEGIGSNFVGLSAFA